MNFFRNAISRLFGKRSFFQGAEYSRLTNSWTPGWLFPQDFKLRSDLVTLQARARELYNNEPLINRFVANLKQNVIGHKGIVLDLNIRDSSGKGDPLANQAIEAAWEDFSDMENCTVTGNMTLLDVQVLCLTSLIIDGEFIIRKWTPFNNSHKFSLEIVDAGRLDVTMNRPATPGQNEIRLGVEIDEFGKPVAYNIKKPVSVLYGWDITYTYSWERVPADQIIHGFFKTAANQTRGLPLISSVMLSIHTLNEYIKAELTAAIVASNLVGVLKSNTGDEFVNSNYSNSSNQVPPVSNSMTLEQGMFKQLAPGQSIEAVNLNHPTNQFGEFQKGIKANIATGLNIGYSTLTGDTAGVNFATMRSIAIQDQEFYKTLQQFLIDHFLDPVFSGWLETQLLIGNLKVPTKAQGLVPLPYQKKEKFNDPKWRVKRYAYMNPAQEASAQINLVQNKMQSRTSIVAEQSGKDYEEVLQEIADEQAIAEKLGVDLPVSTLLLPEPPDPDQKEITSEDENGKPQNN